MKKIIITAVVLLLQAVSVHQAQAATYYVSPSGNDTTGNGSASSPYKTFSKSISVLVPGDELKVMDGTYNEQMVVSKSGTSASPITITAASGRPVIDLNYTKDKLINVAGSYVNVSGFEVREAQEVGGTHGMCITVSGNNVVLDDIKVHDCKGHGVQVESAHVTVQNLEIYQTNLMNTTKSISSGWGSGLKLRIGADDVTLRNNTVYNNYGEGIAVTRGKNVNIENNKVYDNFSVNIYIDNSFNTTVQKNLTYCTGNPAFSFLNGSRPAGIQLAEEYYDGWGAQLNNVVIKNNLVAYCNYNVALFDGGASNSGMKNVKIVHNTFWGAKKTGISFDELPQTTGTEFANNINHFDAGGKHAVIGSRNGINMHHNFWVGSLPEDWMLASGTGDITGVAGLVGIPNISAPDPASFALTVSSPAINAAGSLSVSVPQDYNNSSRVGAADIGAFEFQAGASPSPTASPTPTVSPSPSPSPTVLPSPSPTSSPAPTICQQADIDQSGEVNLIDYSLLASNFFSQNPNPARADIDGNGSVNMMDYSILSSQFFKECV